MRSKILLMFLAALALAAMGAQNAFAAEPAEVNFSVKAIIPENQIDTKQNYFDLKMTPGAKQDIEIEVFNNANAVCDYRVEVNAASTNQGGVIEYSKPAAVRDESLKYDFAQLATVQSPALQLAASESQRVKISIAMPDETFDGIILGGVTITKVPQNTAPETPEQSVAISNEYSYVIGVRLSETDTVVEPDFHLKYVKPKLVNYKTAIAANLQNNQAAIVKGLSITANVYKQGEDASVAAANKSDIDVAPTSNFDFIIDWNNARIVPGEYRLKMTATLDGKQWEWDEPFTVQDEASAEVNDNAIGLKDKADYTWIIIVLGLLILVVLLVLLLRRKRNR